MQLDTALVAPTTFTSLLVMSAEEREEFNREAPRGQRQPQKRSKDGVPVWRLKVAATNWRGMSEMISVTVPLPGNPMDLFSPGTSVEFEGLMIGVSPSARNGYTVWFAAEAVQAAGSPAGLRPVASAASE